jgi:hypothetical protein
VFFRNGNGSKLVVQFFVHEDNIAAVKKGEFIGDGMSSVIVCVILFELLQGN